MTGLNLCKTTHTCRKTTAHPNLIITLTSLRLKGICVLAGNDVVNTVPSGGTTATNTTTLKKYDVESANFHLCDTWGLEVANYKDEHKILPALLEGWLPNNWKMEYQLRDRRRVLLDNDASRYQRRVHAVLFFVAANAVHDDEEMEIVKESFQKVCCICILLTPHHVSKLVCSSTMVHHEELYVVKHAHVLWPVCSFWICLVYV